MPPLTPEELGQLYRRHAPALRLYALQCCASSEDPVQEAFIKLAGQDPPPEQVLPWLYRVVRNAARIEQRAGARRRRREGHVSNSEAWFACADEELDARAAARLLSELPIDLREVIVARIWGGLTFEEVAALVGCSMATAHRRYHTGLAALKERLEGQWTRITPTT